MCNKMYNDKPKDVIKNPSESVCWIAQTPALLDFGMTCSVKSATAKPLLTKPHPIKLLLGLLVALTLLLTACTQTQQSNQIKADQSDSQNSKAHIQKYLDIIDDLKANNLQAMKVDEITEDTNRQFVQAMLAHQQAAVMMAYTELKYGTDADARNMAQRSIDIQQAQMNWMYQWLESYTPAHDAADQVVNADHFAFFERGTQYYQSMIHAAQENSPDKAFVLLMQLHQAQALDMSNQAELLSLDTQIQALADDIYDTQAAQIAQMQAWLDKHKN